MKLRNDNTFLLGPCYWDEIAVVAQLPGAKTLLTWLMLYYQRRTRHGGDSLPTATVLQTVGITAQALQEALSELEAAQLVKVDRSRQPPRVRLL
jgi:hypothetical protein